MATVLSARTWEESFVSYVRSTGRARIVARAYRPIDVERAQPDVVVIGEETPWLSPDALGLWSALGMASVVVGNSGADWCGGTSWSPEDPESITARVREAWLEHRATGPTDVLAVTGPSGSGVTEVACALARLSPAVHVVDRDPPFAALRLGVVPGEPRGSMTVSGEFRLDRPELTIVDSGDQPPPLHGRTVFVVADTPVSFVRAARLVAAWTSEVPDLVLNKVRDHARAIEFAMATIGLEPRLLLEYHPEVAENAARGLPPPRRFTEPLADLLRGGVRPPQ